MNGPERKLRLGVSSCLLGEAVRFDGGHKRSRFVTDQLAPYCEWISVCPELESGMGVPRESLRLAGSPSDPRLIAPRSGTDQTHRMKRFAAHRSAAADVQRLDGFILKKDSPTCGLWRVRVYTDSGSGCAREGRGLWAQGLADRHPLLPVEEEGRLNDPVLRENFVERIFVYSRLSDLRGGAARPRDLVRFHTAHKLTVLAHSPKHYRELGRIVARAGVGPMEERLDSYARVLMDALSIHATAARQVNVLHHLMGYLRDRLRDDERHDLLQVIEDYRAGIVPLVVPLALLKHHFRSGAPGWIREQNYLDPYPADLMLRSHLPELGRPRAGNSDLSRKESASRRDLRRRALVASARPSPTSPSGGGRTAA